LRYAKKVGGEKKTTPRTTEPVNVTKKNHPSETKDKRTVDHEGRKFSMGKGENKRTTGGKRVSAVFRWGPIKKKQNQKRPEKKTVKRSARSGNQLRTAFPNQLQGETRKKE